MRKDKRYGILVFLFVLAVIMLYALWLPASKFIMKLLMRISPDETAWSWYLPVYIVMVVVLGIIAWVKWTRTTTPPLSPKKERSYLLESGFIVSTFVVTLIATSIHFANATNFTDSPPYLELVQFFRGEFPIGELSPYKCSRVLLPLLVAIIYELIGQQVSIPLLFGIFNAIFLTATTYLFYVILKRIEFPPILASGVSFFSIFTFHYGWYGTAVLVDAPFIFCYLLGVYYMLTHVNHPRYWFKMTLLVSIGVLFKESILFLVPAVLYYDIRLKDIHDWGGLKPQFKHYFPILVIPPSLILIIRLYYYTTAQIRFYMTGSGLFLTSFWYLTYYSILFELLHLLVFIILANRVLLKTRKLFPDEFQVLVDRLNTPKMNHFLMSLIAINTLFILYAFFIAGFFDARQVWPLYYPLVIFILRFLINRLNLTRPALSH